MTDSVSASLLPTIRVLDLTTPRAELAGQVLAQLGAEVFKVEPPGGAAARRIGPFAGGREGDPDASLYWATVGMGKRNTVLDITDPAAQAALRAFAATCDVLVESFDPGYLARFGLDYASLRAINPALVYASVTPYGQSGPDALSPSSELVMEAAGGLAGLQGDGDRPPIPVGYPQAAFHAGAQAAADIVVALNERANSGLGQHLDVSTQACVVWTLLSATGYPPNHGTNPPGTSENRAKPRPQLVAGVDAPSVWRCKDGYVTCTFALGILGGRTFDRIVRWMAAEGAVSPAVSSVLWETWIPDATAGTIPLDLVREAVAAVVDFFLTKTKRELMDRAVPDNLLLAPVYTPRDLLADPQLASRDFWTEVGGRTHPGPALKLTRTPLKLLPAPALAEAAPLPRDARAPSVPVASAAPRSRAFEGLRVADFAWVGVGPIISKAFADHGATVVHVESITRPDILRTLPPFKDATPGIDRSQFFANFNTSKLGLSLNLANPAGNAIARRLAAWADVVVESFTPGTLDRLGLGYADLSRGHDDLIMLSTCLRGQTGPERGYAGFGGQGSALSGLFAVTGWPGRPPTGPWGAYTDLIAPRYGVATLGAAILERRTSGLGQHIDLSQIETATHFVEPLILDYTVNGRDSVPAGHESAVASPHGIYATEGEERYVALSTESAAEWRALRGVAPLAAFSGARFDDIAARREADAEIDAALAEWLRCEEPFAVAARLKAAGVPASVVLRPTDLYDDPQLTHRDFFRVCEHPEMGPTPYDGHATIFSDMPIAFSAPPMLGQHTDMVLREILGMTGDEVATAAAEGALT